MSDERIAEIAERLAKATPGPWRAEHRHIDMGPDDNECAGLGLEVIGPQEASLRGQFARGADAQFIAHAPADISHLLSEVQRLRVIEGAAKALPKHGPVVAFGDLIEWCLWCDERAPDDHTPVTHTPDCPWPPMQRALGAEGA